MQNAFSIGFACIIFTITIASDKNTRTTCFNRNNFYLPRYYLLILESYFLSCLFSGLHSLTICIWISFLSWFFHQERIVDILTFVVSTQKQSILLHSQINTDIFLIFSQIKMLHFSEIGVSFVSISLTQDPTQDDTLHLVLISLKLQD